MLNVDLVKLDKYDNVLINTLNNNFFSIWVFKIVKTLEVNKTAFFVLSGLKVKIPLTRAFALGTKPTKALCTKKIKIRMFYISCIHQFVAVIIHYACSWVRQKRRSKYFIMGTNICSQ